jgi:hypothetical protein
MVPRGANPWARPGELNLLQDNMALKKFQAPRSLALSELASCLGGREDGAEVRGEGLAAREARWFRWAFADTVANGHRRGRPCDCLMLAMSASSLKRDRGKVCWAEVRPAGSKGRSPAEVASEARARALSASPPPVSCHHRERSRMVRTETWMVGLVCQLRPCEVSCGQRVSGGQAGGI